MQKIFDFEDLKNKKILELADTYISKALELLRPVMDIQSELFLKVNSVREEINELLKTAQTTAEDIQTLLNHIKDINQAIETCKELTSATFLLVPLFHALTFFLL